MTKRIAFWVLLVFVIAGSAMVASAAGTDDFTLAASTQDKTATTIAGQTVEENVDLAFGASNASDEPFLVDITVVRDYSMENPLAYVVCGTVVTTETFDNTVADPYIMMLYIETADGFVPLYKTKGGEVTTSNKAQGSFLLYAKVNLLNLGSDVVNNLRFVVFRKSDLDALVLNENMQITDMEVIARRYTTLERIRITLNNVVETVTTLP